jgi:hypothetical protein
MARYCHAPLSQPHTIRLLRILPSKENSSSIRCEIFECALRHSDGSTRPYEALSYVWGSERKPQSITIVADKKQDHHFDVTQSLHAVLVHLRDHDIPRVIWVDAVCINQTDKAEKGHQIPYIAEIYAKASSVLVWLGEAKDDSDKALEAIQVVSGSTLELLETLQLPVRPITKLLERPWFRRIWVR